jgi:restriction system protein
VARRKPKTNRQARKIRQAGASLLVLGVTCLVLPAAMRDSAIGAAFAGLPALGWPIAAAGALALVAGLALERRGHRAPVAVQPAPPTVYLRTPTSSDTRSRGELTGGGKANAAAVASPVAGVKPPARPERWSETVFDVIEWRRFEAVVERMFQQAGFVTRSQSHGADGGVDVWLYTHQHPRTPVGAVQCKHWQGKRIGVDKIRELKGVMAARGIERGHFAATTTFTDDAIAFAQSARVNLLDVTRLLDVIAKRTAQQQAELLAVALEGDYWCPTCVNCGVKMIYRQRRSDGSPFWGCANYRTCKTPRIPMRVASK